jgi:endonuclease III
MKLEVSPYDTRQEQYREDPWKMLMVCFMLNQTSHKQVDQIREAFFNKFPNAESLISASEAEIAQEIKILGFYNKRAKAWKEFSLQWIAAVEKHGGTNIPVYVLEKMKGIGKYALDSWKVFQLYDYDIEVDDHVLNWYVDWARVEKERLIRENKPWKPMSVYYLHFEDEREVIHNWKKCKDYVCCVMARTQKEAIEVTKWIALDQKHAKHIKILGIGHCKEEWTHCEQPMTTDEQAMRAQLDAMFARIYNKS